MDKICAVVDCQGFTFPDRFIGRELAVVSEYISQCQEIDPQLKWQDLTAEEKSIVLYSTSERHGLHHYPFNSRNFCYLPYSSEMGSIIKLWHEMIATEEKPLFAYKNHQLGKILLDNNIPCLDLDQPEYKFPKYADLQNRFGDNYLCAYHKRRKGTDARLICAYRKAAHIFREVNESVKQMDWN